MLFFSSESTLFFFSFVFKNFLFRKQVRHITRFCIFAIEKKVTSSQYYVNWFCQLEKSPLLSHNCQFFLLQKNLDLLQVISWKQQLLFARRPILANLALGQWRKLFRYAMQKIFSKVHLLTGIFFFFCFFLYSKNIVSSRESRLPSSSLCYLKKEFKIQKPLLCNSTFSWKKKSKYILGLKN